MILEPSRAEPGTTDRRPTAVTVTRTDKIHIHVINPQLLDPTTPDDAWPLLTYSGDLCSENLNIIRRGEWILCYGPKDDELQFRTGVHGNNPDLIRDALNQAQPIADSYARGTTGPFAFRISDTDLWHTGASPTDAPAVIGTYREAVESAVTVDEWASVNLSWIDQQGWTVACYRRANDSLRESGVIDGYPRAELPPPSEIAHLVATLIG